ncbi:hypothetical protein SALBM311S_10651 [Streptomyces alboniger]
MKRSRSAAVEIMPPSAHGYGLCSVTSCPSRYTSAWGEGIVGSSAAGRLVWRRRSGRMILCSSSLVKEWPVAFSTIRPRTRELSPLYCCSKWVPGGPSVAAANESRRRASGCTALSCHGVRRPGRGSVRAWASRSSLVEEPEPAHGDALVRLGQHLGDVPPRRCVQADPVLGDELEDHRVGEHLGDAAGPGACTVSGDRTDRGCPRRPRLTSAPATMSSGRWSRMS